MSSKGFMHSTLPLGRTIDNKKGCMMTYAELMVKVLAILPTATMELDGYREIIINTNLTFADDDSNLTEMTEDD